MRNTLNKLMNVGLRLWALRPLAVLLLALALSACDIAMPTPDTFSSKQALADWGCSAIGGFMPIILVLAMLLGVVNIILYGISQFGQGVVPGGFLSWTQQNIPNIIKGSLILALGPMVVVALMGSLAGVDVASCTFTGGGN